METVSFTRQLSVAENVDVLVVGAGPAGIFTALEMIKKGSAMGPGPLCLIRTDV